VEPNPRDIIASTMHTISDSSDFPTTRWTFVAAAGNGNPTESRRALETLCESYWYLLYAYARRRGDSPEAAQDHTQEFFVRFLERDYLDRADRDRGRFRSFLLASFKFYLCDAADRARAQKRGGGLAPLPFEMSSGEERYSLEPFHNETPERIYERRWARTLLDLLRAQVADIVSDPGEIDSELRYLIGALAAKH
jgi:DNA-directed RNA polymerase specialized sigma24 family protein